MYRPKYALTQLNLLWSFEKLENSPVEVEEDDISYGGHDQGDHAGRDQSGPDLEGHQFNMAVFFWYFEKSDLSSVHYCTRVHWTSHFVQGTKNTQSC